MYYTFDWIGFITLNNASNYTVIRETVVKGNSHCSSERSRGSLWEREDTYENNGKGEPIFTISHPMKGKVKGNRFGCGN